MRLQCELSQLELKLEGERTRTAKEAAVFHERLRNLREQIRATIREQKKERGITAKRISQLLQTLQDASRRQSDAVCLAQQAQQEVERLQNEMDVKAAALDAELQDKASLLQ